MTNSSLGRMPSRGVVWRSVSGGGNRSADLDALTLILIEIDGRKQGTEPCIRSSPRRYRG